MSLRTTYARIRNSILYRKEHEPEKFDEHETYQRDKVNSESDNEEP
ncbi:hypothetical protein BH18THE1_BH18THE1_11680 [soil metagenome]